MGKFMRFLGGGVLSFACQTWLDVLVCVVGMVIFSAGIVLQKEMSDGDSKRPNSNDNKPYRRYGAYD